uniref:Uncharacterized protein n=1 Tax=Trichobilharzia regenti TaxID=157069 RepID=A0AA85KI45_TRIRE|nr:unnamed protein product [Trichobilharzia regenti]
MPGSITGVGVAGVSTVSGHLDYSQLDLNDDLVAKDLQLTDSDDDSCLSGQGGELCTDENDVVGLNLVGNEEDVDDRGDGDGVEGVHTPDDYTGYNLSNYQVMPQNDSLSYDQHCQQEHQQQQHQHQSDDNNPVSFFISDEDDDDS